MSQNEDKLSTLILAQQQALILAQQQELEAVEERYRNVCAAGVEGEAIYQSLLEVMPECEDTPYQCATCNRWWHPDKIDDSSASLTCLKCAKKM